jgi:hypothetical protein
MKSLFRSYIKLTIYNMIKGKLNGGEARAGLNLPERFTMSEAIHILFEPDGFGSTGSLTLIGPPP